MSFVSRSDSARAGGPVGVDQDAGWQGAGLDQGVFGRARTRRRTASCRRPARAGRQQSRYSSTRSCSASVLISSVLPHTRISPPGSARSFSTAAGTSGPRSREFFQPTSVSVRDATYLGMRLYLLVSSPCRPSAFSSHTPQEPAKISYVLRPSNSASVLPSHSATISPISGASYQFCQPPCSKPPSAVLLRAAGRLDDAVEGDERLHHDRAHIRFSLVWSGLFSFLRSVWDRFDRGTGKVSRTFPFRPAEASG